MQTPHSEQRESVFREVHLRDYWKVVWQGRWTILAVFIVVVGATAVFTFLQKPVFQSTATLEVQPKANQLAAGQDVSGLGAAGYGWFAEEKYHNTQVEILKSRDVSIRVVERLDLDNHPRFSEFPDPVDALRGMLQVVPRRETGLIEISLFGADPHEITRWVNAVAASYVERNIEKARGNMQEAISTIADQMESLKEEFSAAETERFNALSEQGNMRIFNPEEQEAIVREQLQYLNGELTKVRNELSELSESLQQMRELPATGDPMSLPEIAADQTMHDLHRSRVEVERELESARVDFKPGHPAFERLGNELRKVEESMMSRAREIWGAREAKLGLAQKKQKYLQDELSYYENFSLEVAQAASDYKLVKTSAETKGRVFDMINKTLNEVQLQAQFLSNNVSVLDEAVAPRYPVRPRKKLNLAIGGLFGLFLGLAAAFFLDYLDNTFRTPEDVEKYLSTAVLGVIPKLADAGLKNRAAREAYQSLRTSVIFSSKNRQRKVILITSTGPQEGKSSTVANLGRTLASTGDRVIIIDCDLRRPTQHNQLGLERDHGITNYLAAPLDRTDWTTYTKTAGPSSLHALTCGPLPPNPPELLGTERFTALLAAARDHYDWVLVDSPPASSLADASLLVAMADMMVLVVRHNHTDRDLVTKTVQRLRSVKDNLAGVVLNNVDLERAYNKDYYYAGYYYYGEEGDRRAKKKGGRGAAPKASVG